MLNCNKSMMNVEISRVTIIKSTKECISNKLREKKLNNRSIYLFQNSKKKKRAMKEKGTQSDGLKRK